jgi:predicted NAD/FAD-dependent oxidoreductase
LNSDVVIVGAGVAGLSCARELARQDRSPLVLERAPGVGGRCATRRIDGQPVDHGVAFLHGSEPEFLADLRAVEGASPIQGWPSRTHGHGTPCQPDAFAERESCIAFREGVSAFPKHLARDLDVRFGANVVSIEPSGTRFRLRTADGKEWIAPDVVIALAVEQTITLLDPLADVSPEFRSALGLLRMVGSLPCLTVIAGYPPDVVGPSWHISYPEESRVIQLISHDSSKRSSKRFVVLVAQARPGWSGSHLQEPVESWSGAMIEETAELVGAWARRPIWTHAHRWRYARVDRGNELSRPLLIHHPDGARLGLAGELFAWGGGVEAAWLSGRLLASRLVEESVE